VKLIYYGFIFWLPYFFETSEKLQVMQTAMLASLLDIGGLFGGPCAGLIADASKYRAGTIVCYLLLAIPIMFLYVLAQGHTSFFYLLVPMTGFLIGGCSHFISAVVPADIANKKEIARMGVVGGSVSGIIDGLGSLGAGTGQILVTYK
jgi:sugar phosphate permease